MVQKCPREIALGLDPLVSLYQAKPITLHLNTAELCGHLKSSSDFHGWASSL